MKKGLLVLLSAFLLLFTACDSWMQDDEFYDDIENEVKVANAQQISVFVRYAMTRQGKTDPDGPATFKVEIPHSISATTEPEFGFVRWAAFSTEFLETGNNQSKNKDVYFIDYEDYNARLLPKEIKSPVVVFEDATNPTTTVTINENRNDIFLVPIVAQRPTVSLTIPAKGSSGVVRNMSVRINFTKPMDEDSFKNSEGVFDKITVTQGIQTFTTDGDIEISSVDITDRFEAPVFSANKKMVTLRFNQESISEGYDSQSSVNIIISKDVKDIFGFAMTDDDKISFSVGSSMDTLAPRITSLTAGTTLTNFDTFKGMYKDAATWGNITAFTKMDPHQKGSGQTATYLGAKDAPVNNLDSSFYDTFAPPADASNSGYRITDKIYIHALAEDIAGSGSNQNQTGIETDVAMLGVRATLMYNADGTVPDASATNVTIPTTSVNYMPQSVGQSLAKDYVYKNLVHAINVKNGTPNASDEGYIAEDKGFLFEYDLSSLPDGLIRVDIFAVDMVQNSGLAVGGELSEEYGNGYASIFVVKDTTAPDAIANSGHVIVDTGADSHITADNYFNEVTYSRLKIKGDTSSIVDYGHPRLRSHHDNMKWIVKPTSEVDWVSSIKTTDSSWGSITSNYGPFPNPGNEGKVYYTYALMDDVGNISNAVGINPIYYDSVAPAVQNPYFVADEGFTAGVAKDNVLNEQTLVIPVKEITSGLKSIELMVRKNGATTDYATPLADSSLAVVAKDKDGNEVPYTVDSAKKVITFNQPITDFDSNVTIKGLKLSDNLNEQGSFEVSVLVKDAAAADSVHETLPANPAISNTDSIPVQINTVYIPNIRKTERFGVANSAEFWIDYNASTLTKRAGSNPLTDVYITFTEETSGAKIFDFTGSSITLTDDANGNGSKIYKVNAATGTIDGIAIPSTVSGNKLIINSSVDAKDYFANPNGEHKLTVKITNVALANEGTDSAIALKIYDTATNGSAAGTTICSNEGSLNLTTPGISTAGFKFDSAEPSSEMAENALCDRDGTESDSTATEASGKTAAELGYTNENLINATVTLNPRASGISSLRISGDAAFVSSTAIKANGNDAEFDVSDSGKVVTFKQNNNHVVLGNATAASVILTINNLQLTSGDGAKSITFLARGFGNVEDSVGSTKSITLDTQAPQWIDNGLYAAAHGNVASEGVYPHSISDGKAYGLAGIDSTNPAELYFYRRYNICIKPDVSDDNLKDAAALIDYTHDGVAVDNNNAAYAPGYALNGDGYTDQTGVFTATAKDKAGNKSTVKTFHIVADTSFASADDCSKIDQYMVLYKPAGAFIHRNEINVSDITEYVIKGDAQYQIRVKLGGASTVSNSDGNEETIDKPGTGATQLLTDSYLRKNNTTTSSKIESYYVSTSSYYSSTPTAPSSSYFCDYTAGSSCTNGSINCSVDDAGTIIINIPKAGSAPLVLWLRDGCGNVVHRKIRPTSMAASGSLSAISWLVDSEIGKDEHRGSVDTSLPSVSVYSDITFYNESNTPTLTVSSFSESCRFKIADNDTAEDKTKGDEDHYSLKSRIIVWEGTGVPDRDDFYASTLNSSTASNWDYRKEAPASQAEYFGGSTAFTLTNNFPKYASSNRYKLYYIVEDTVGNYQINQIKRSGTDISVAKIKPETESASGIEYWLYDNTAPVVDEDSIAFQKVNQVTVGSEVRNYYSANSKVTYNITDSGSGIYHDGSGTTSYPGFDSRRTAITPKTYSIPSVSDGSAPILSGIKDYAENTLSAITLKNGTSSKWYYRGTAPVLTGTTSSNKAWAEKTSTFGYVTTTLGTDSETDGQILSLKAKSSSSSLNVYLSVTDSEELLGWKISRTKLTLDGTECFSASEVTQLTYDSTKKQYTYSYDKGFMNYDSWTSSSSIVQSQYFYPVNRAGLVGKPIKVVFVENVKPAITNGENNNGYTYSSNTNINDTYLETEAPPTAYTIKAGISTPKINYTRNGATVTFTTTQAPTHYKFVYGPGDNNRWGDDDDDAGTLTALSGSGPTYTIPLDSTEVQGRTSSASGTSLRIQLSRGTEEDSDVYELNGPAGNNLWVYDNTTPSISFTASSDVKSGSSTGTAPASSEVTSDNTMYIQNENAFIKFTLSNASDITHFQWKKRTNFTSDTEWSKWTDITSGRDGGNLTFAAPAEKTEYMFRAIDTAGNISTATTAVKLQRDDEAPDGTFVYETRKGDVTSSTTDDKKDLTDTGLGAGEGVDNPYGGNNQVRDISYSNSPESPYYITHIWVNLSGITDNGRSGIQNFIIKKDGITKDGTALTDETLTSDAGSYRIDLSDNGTSTVEYEVWVTDNINQSRKLQTFRTTVDGDAPVLSNLLIQAKDSDGENASNAVLYPNATSGVYYLKNTRAYITYDIDDAFATYEWSTTGNTNDWHNSNHSTIEASSTNITWTFDAPEEETTYFFRGRDRVKNTSDPVSFKIQKDMWAPDVPSSVNDGLIAYSLYNSATCNDTTKKTALTAADGTTNLITETGSKINQDAAVEIKYSSNSSANSSNYIKTMIIDLSAVTDDVEGTARSGFENFYVSVDGGTYTSIGSVSATGFSYSSDSKKITLTLPDNSYTQKSYTIKVKDKIGQERILRTFTLKPDGTKPDLELKGTDTVLTEAEGNVYHNSTYFVKGTNAVINFTKTSASTPENARYAIDRYEFKESSSTEWTNIPIANNSNLIIADATVSYTLPAPASTKTYQFRAIDEVGNISTVQELTIVQDITAPQGTAGNPQFENANGTVTSGFVKTVSQTDTTDISYLYNSNIITMLKVNVASISETADDSNSGFLGYFINDSDTALTATSSPVSLSGNNLTIALASTSSDTPYAIKVKDNVGNSRTLYTFHFAKDGDAPDFTLKSVKTKGTGSTYDVEPADDVYYLKRANAILTFETTTPEDIDHYEWDSGTGTYITNPIELKNMSYTFTAPEPVEDTYAPTTYKFRAVDKVGNAKEITPVKLVHDETSPSGTITEITLRDQDGNAFTDTSYYNASTPEGSKTTTIIYNSNKVKSITLTDSGTDNNGGSGYDNTTLWYQVGDESNTHAMDNKTLALSSDLNNTTYHIIAKDKVGNKKEIWTYVFTADGAGPELNSSKVTVNSNVNMIHSYTARKPKVDGNGYDDLTSIPYVVVGKIGDKEQANLCSNGTQILYAKTDIPDAVKYQIVMTETTNSSNGYNATAAADGWLAMNDGTEDNSGSNFIFALPEVHEHHRRLALFFMDSLGNESTPYYIGNKDSGQFDIQWWLTSPELSSSNVGISGVELLNDSTKTGWQGVKNDYLVSIKLPKNAVVHSIALAPEAGSGNTGVVWALGASGEIKDQIYFTGYDLTDTKVTELKTACINPKESTEVGLKLKIYVWDKNKDNANITQADPKIIINGNIELTVFPEGGYSFNIVSTGREGIRINDISDISTGIVNAGKVNSTSRVSSFFNSVANVFARDSEVVENGVNEKPAETAKKAAKKAKKTAKKAGKKASAKTQIAEKPVMTVETAEIVDETVSVTVPEVTAVAESIVNELTGVTENVKGESEVVTIAPAAEAVVEVEAANQSDEASGKTPSKSAVIVIMLAILSSLSGVWYYKKGRKE